MALDRESIERKDFSIVKRGYDPGAVAARLSAIADEVEELQRGGRRVQPETLAGAVSEQVRGIVEAAENSAAEILRGAELEAQEIRAQASRATEKATGEAQRRREQAASQTRDHVARISNSISHLLGRLEAIDGELNALTASVRTDTERLREELMSLEGELEGSSAAPAGEAARVESEPAGHATGAPEAISPQPAAEYSSESAKLVDEPFEAQADAPPASPEHAEGAHTESSARSSEDLEGAHTESSAPSSAAPSSEAPSSEDTEGARLIALNMALNGTPREETARYLAETYNLVDSERLLDEVYASVQG